MKRTPYSSRIEWIDSLRGFSILLVLFHHSTIIPGYHFAELVSFNGALATIRMPVLFFIAGAMTAGSFAKRGAGPFALARFRTAVWPYLIWQFVYILQFHEVRNGGIHLHDWLAITPSSYLWFLLFLNGYFLITILARTIRLPWSGIVGAVALLWALCSGIVEKFFFFSFFFFLGCASLQILRSYHPSSRLIIPALAAIVTLSLLSINVDEYGWVFMIICVLSVACIVTVFASMKPNDLTARLGWVGQSAVVFYVLHFPCYIAIRTVGTSLHWHTPLYWLGALIFVTVICTIAAMFRKTFPFSILFEYPKRWVPRELSENHR